MTEILTGGTAKGDRTGTGTISQFGCRLVFDLQQGFPLLTLKHTPFRLLAEEMFWFIRGESNVKTLNAKGIHIWDPWADETGNLGPVYGHQWRSWQPAQFENMAGDLVPPIDQLAEAQRKLIESPDDRRIIVSAWNVADLEDMALPPCHMMFQFYSRPMSLQERKHWFRESGRTLLGSDDPNFQSDVLDKEGVPTRFLDMQLYQRSADMFIGVPFNIAQYALLQSLMAHGTNHAAGKLTWVGGDCHIYKNHIEQTAEMLRRTPYPSPRLAVVEPTPRSIWEYSMDSVYVDLYQAHDKIRAEVSV